jgi:glycosyltransferase involved in cell wall biosynthesis
MPPSHSSAQAACRSAVVRASPPGAIAHVLPWVNIGGTELQTLRLAQAARQLDYSNLIYLPVGATKVRALFVGESFEILEYEQVQPSYTKPAPFWKNSRRLASSFRERQVQIVHCSDILAAHFTGFAGRMAGARVVTHVRNHYPSIGRREESFLLPVERFVFVSKNTRENFGSERARKRSQILYDVPGVVYKPVADRAAARASFGLPQHGHVFGMAARVSPQKDFPTLIQAARIVAEKLPDCSFLIAGDHQLEAPHRAHYESLLPLLEETGMRGRFFFAGFQSEMARFYGAIDTFVLSSNWEGLPTVTLEAILYGRPVVSTEVGGIAEAIQDGVSGFLTPTKSPETLARRLLEIATDPALAQRMTECAQRTLEETFGQRRFLKQVDELYSGLLRRR